MRQSPSIAAALLFWMLVIVPAPTIAQDITVSGRVTDLAEKAVPLIKVSVYRDGHLLSHGFTNEAGQYEVRLSAGSPVTVLFDTHSTLNNSGKWHPSLLANMAAKTAILLNRSLVPVGFTGGWVADVDALFGYQFVAAIIESAPKADRAGPARTALERIQQLKLSGEVLGPMIQSLKAFFERQL
jgi:hypothetical protein